MLFSNKDVAVLDLTHGGIPLARSIVNQANSVTAIDVYGTIDKEVLLDLEKDEIIIKDNLNSIDLDLIVAPVHMDPALMPDLLSCPVITHHMAVGELLLNGIKGSGIIEITGTVCQDQFSNPAGRYSISQYVCSITYHSWRGALVKWCTKDGISRT